MRFLAVLLAWIAAFALVVMAAVRLVDPRGDFGTGLFPVVSLFARGQKLELFRRFLAAGPEVGGLVLGSSRSMKLSPFEFGRATGLRYFNFSVDVAKAEDYLATYRWVRAQGARPRHLVVGLDVEALDDLPTLAVFEDTEAFRRALDGRAQPGPLERLVSLITDHTRLLATDYLKDAARSASELLRQRAGRAERESFMVFEPDGYLRYPRYEGQRARGSFDLSREIELCLPTYEAKYTEAGGLSARRVGYLERLVAEATGDGATVTIFLTPLHPRALEAVEGTSYDRLLDGARAVLRELGARPGVRVLDLSEVGRYGGEPDTWYDCAHYDERDASRITRLVAIPPED